MRPVRVEFQAFGPYAGYEMVDFESVSSKGLFLICGKTGIGKTMILDAMTFALFGKSSGHGRDDFEAMRCTNAERSVATFVRFEFENAGEYYLFERRLEQKRVNLSASYNVSKKDDSGAWQPLMENAKEKAVNARAAEIIGLEYEQFRQVIVLPQGQFERLLTSNSEEKEKILTSIFGEDKWQLIAEKLYNRAEKERDNLRRVQERINGILSGEDCGTFDELTEKLERMKKEEADLEAEYAGTDYDKIIKEQQEQLLIAKDFGELHKTEKRIAELEAARYERDNMDKALADARRAEKVTAFVEDEENALDRLRDRENELKAAVQLAEEKEKSGKEMAQKAKAHLEKEKEIEALRAKELQYEGRRADYEGLEELDKKLKAARKAADKAAADEKKALAASDNKTQEIVKLNIEYTSLQKEHETLLNSYLAGITGELAGQLVEGMPCPVCGSCEHPEKACLSENSVGRNEADSKKKEADLKYNELQEAIAEQVRLKAELDLKHLETEKRDIEVSSLSFVLQDTEKKLIPGIATAKALEKEIKALRAAVEEYEAEKIRLLDAEKIAKEEYIEAGAKADAAAREAEAAREVLIKAEEKTEKALTEHGLESRKEAKSLSINKDEMDRTAKRIADYDAKLRAERERLAALRVELKGKAEPDDKKCREMIDTARNSEAEYRANKAVLIRDIEEIGKKIEVVRTEGDGIMERIREADEDVAFAKKLRGDSGTGLGRYVLGVLFSSVVAAANSMLEMVHGGRYRLYRSDDKARGTNKRGLELKVFDRNIEEHDGRFVSTLSGGEKFLVSLALSIGMSTVAGRSGLRMEALFIDEGFGSLDEDSIDDAMNVLTSIQEANGMVGIISHVQILEERIPTKLRVEGDANGSRIIQTVG